MLLCCRLRINKAHPITSMTNNSIIAPIGSSSSSESERRSAAPIIAPIGSSSSSESEHRSAAPRRHPGAAVASAMSAKGSCSNVVELPALVPPSPSGFGSPASAPPRRLDAAIASCPPIPRYIFVPCRLPPCMQGRNYKVDPLECLFCGHRFKSSGGRASHQNYCRLNPSGRSIKVKPWNRKHQY